MRKVTFVRWGVMAALAAVGGVGALAVGCSDDDSSTTTTPDGGGKDVTTTTDTGTKTDTGTSDTGPGDDGGGTDSGPKPVAKLIIVHASPRMKPFRMCFATAKPGGAPIVTPLQALPDTPTSGQTSHVPPLPPGIYPGTGGPLPQFPIDVTSIDITPFVLFADDAKLANQTSANTSESGCSELIGTDGQGGSGANALTKNVDYVQLATVPATTFALGSTYLLALVGCLPTAADPGAKAQECGGDYDATAGNLSVGIVALDKTTPAPDGGMGISFAHRASAIEGLFPGNFTANGVIPGLIGVKLVPFDAGPPEDAGDAGDSGDAAPTDAAPVDAAPTPTPFVIPLTSAPVKYGAKQLDPATAFPAVGLDPNQTPIGIFVPNADGGTLSPGSFFTGSGNLIFALPFYVVQTLTTGYVPTPVGGDGGASIFVNGSNYTFVLLGAPPGTQEQLVLPDGGPNPAYDGRGMHIIAFPNDLAVPSL